MASSRFGGVEPHRLAEVISTLHSGGSRRGSGYRVGPRRVLTAFHVVVDAAAIRVRFDADRDGEWATSAECVWNDIRTDVAILELDDSGHAESVTPARIGRLPDRAARLGMCAIGFPRFKLKSYPGSVGGWYRDSHQADGVVSVLSNRRARTLELTVAPPGHDPDPDVSPWEGMSGAAVWVDDAVVGVVARHHRADGPGRLEATRIDDCVDGLDDADRERLLGLLGVPGLEDIQGATSPTRREHADAVSRLMAEAIAPVELVGRHDELIELGGFRGSGVPYLWWQGGPNAGKTALVSWFVLHPPPDTDVVAFFVSGRLHGRSAGDRFVTVVAEQLAALAEGRAPSVAAGVDRRHGLQPLLDAAARTAQEDGRHLLLVVDGLDEDTSSSAGRPSVASLLPRHVPRGLQVLVSSRPLADLPDDVPTDHPLRTCERRPLAVSPNASGEHRRARRELARLVEGSPLQRDVTGFLAAAGGLTLRELEELTGRPRYELTRLLTGPFAHSLTSRTDERRREGGDDEVFLLAHETLRETAIGEYGREIERYRTGLHDLAEEYRASGWPVDTPSYLLFDYTSFLEEHQDADRLLACALDAVRHDRMFAALGEDSFGLGEMATALALIGRVGATTTTWKELHQEHDRLAARSRVMTSTAAARRLGLDRNDLRRLRYSGRLVPSPRFPGVEVWETADVERLLQGPVQATRCTTPDSRALLPAESALTRLHDVCFEYCGSRCHVRVWDGVVGGEPRIVVLIGALQNEINKTINFIEDLSSAIDNRLLEGRGGDAVWFGYLHSRHPERHEFTNILLDKVTPRSWALRSAAILGIGARVLMQPPYRDPRWRPTTAAEIERLVGEAVECYPEPAYTEATVEERKRSGEMVEVEHDTAALRVFLKDIVRLEELPRDHARAGLAAEACVLLAEEVRLRGDVERTQPWDDGSSPDGYEGRHRAGLTFAASLVQVTLSRYDRQRIDRHPDDTEWPWTPEEFARRLDLLRELEAWSLEVGAFGDDPDPSLSTVVDRCVRTLRHWLTVSDRAHMAGRHPASGVAGVFEIQGALDRRYIDSVRWLTETHTPTHRMLRARYGEDQVADVRFGRDPHDRVVAHHPPSATFAVDWPLLPPSRGMLPDEARIVACKNNSGGTRPAYIDVPGKALDLLPCPPAQYEQMEVSWSFGYGGTGPGMLERAIADLLERVDGIERSQVPEGWIEQQVGAPERTELSISVGGLRQRYRKRENG